MLSTLYRALGTVIFFKLVILLYHIFSSLVCTDMSTLLTLAFNCPKALKLFYKWYIHMSCLIVSSEVNKLISSWNGIPYILIPLTGITGQYRREYTWSIHLFDFISPLICIIPLLSVQHHIDFLTIIYYACDLFIHTTSYKFFISSNLIY